MERIPRPQDISWFIDLNSRKQLDLDPPYQRKSVWTRGDKQFFLDTLFRNYPCPPIFLHKSMSDNGETVYHVVDGKQRLTTILEFVAGAISIPKTITDPKLAGKRWNELDPDSKRAFWNYLITVEMLPEIDDNIVNTVFERINRNSRKLTGQELRHSKFDGWLVGRAETEAEKAEWKTFGVVTTARAKRMADIQFVSELMMMTINRAVSGFDQDALDKFYADYDVPSETAPNFNEEEFDQSFEYIKHFLLQMNEANQCVQQFGRTLGHFYSLWAYILLNKPASMDPATAATRYAAFMGRVVEFLQDELEQAIERATEGMDKLVADYAVNVRGANTDARPRTERLAALTAAMNQEP